MIERNAKSIRQKKMLREKEIYIDLYDLDGETNNGLDSFLRWLGSVSWQTGFTWRLVYFAICIQLDCRFYKPPPPPPTTTTTTTYSAYNSICFFIYIFFSFSLFLHVPANIWKWEGKPVPICTTNQLAIGHHYKRHPRYAHLATKNWTNKLMNIIWNHILNEVTTLLLN